LRGQPAHRRNGQGTEEQAARRIRTYPDGGRKMNVTHAFTDHAMLDTALQELGAAKHDWARVCIAERLTILSEIKDALLLVGEDWAGSASRAKQLPEGSALEAEEWLTGPSALASACKGLSQTPAKMEGKAFMSNAPRRKLPNGQ